MENLNQIVGISGYISFIMASYLGLPNDDAFYWY